MNYALIKNGVVENVIVAGEDFISTIVSEYDHIELLDTPEEQKVAGPGWIYVSETGEFIAPEQPSNETWKITKLAFKNRFPRAKWMAAKAAAEVNPEMADFFETFNLATYIDLQREDTIADVSHMKDPSVPESFRLTEEEYAAVMLIPAKPEEIPSFI